MSVLDLVAVGNSRVNIGLGDGNLLFGLGIVERKLGALDIRQIATRAKSCPPYSF